MANYTRFQLRGDTKANWLSANPVLAEREPALETDTNRYKIGDGVSTYSQLSYGRNTGEYASVYNVTSLYPLPSGFYEHSTAILAIPSGERTLGLIITYETASGVWYTERFIGTDIANWGVAANWEKLPDAGDLAQLRSDLSEGVEDNKFVAKNVFDSSDENIVRNYVINSSGQMYDFTSTGWITTGFIPTKRGKHYRPVAASNAFQFYVCFFDANKAAIGGTYINSTLEYITVPNNSNIAFMRISIQESVLHGCLYDSKYISKVGVPYNNYCDLLYEEDTESRNVVVTNVFNSNDEDCLLNKVLYNGVVHADTFSGWTTTGFIRTNIGDCYRPANLYKSFEVYVGFYDVNKNVIGYINGDRVNYVQTPNTSGVAYIRLSIKTDELGGCLYNSKNLIYGIIPFNEKVVDGNLVSDKYNNMFLTKNVFNSNDEDCLLNKVLYSGAVLGSTFNGWTTTGYIETSPGKCFRPCNYSTQFEVYVGFYDISKNVISYINQGQVNYIETPNNASIKYIRISIKTDILDGCLYDSKYVTDKKIPYNSIMANLYSVDIPKRYTDGNHVVWVGTSIPEGATYPKKSCENNGYQCINMALGGSSLRYTSTKPSGFSGSLSAKVSELESRYRQDVTDGIITESKLDLWKNRCYERAILPYINGTNSIQVSMIVIDHGVNDAANIHSLLENESSIDWNSRDRDNFVGAFNFVIDEIMKINPTIKIVISGHYSNTYIHGAENSYHFADVCRMQTLLAEKWEFSIMKAWEHTQISNEFIAGSSDYLSNLNTQYGTSFVKADRDSDGNIKSLQIYCPDTIHPHSDPTGNTNKRLNAVYTKLLEKSL